MTQTKTVEKKKTSTLIKKYIPFYVMVLPALVLVFLFSYKPMTGLVIAFKDFKMARGIWESEWVGFEHFQKLFSDPNFYRVFMNTIKISALTLLTTFPVTIIFTLLVNEIMNTRFKKWVQTITYMPHFLSWVVVGAMVSQILSPTSGIVNAVLMKFGVIEKPIFFMSQADMFLPMYLVTNLWKTTGYSIVVYLATISGIDQGMYEAAYIDGANRFQRVLHITLPCMLPTMVTMLILSIGSLISVGFDPIYNLANDATYRTADVISTYVYRKGLVDSQYDYTTAIGLFQNLISLGLVLFANWFSRKANSEYKVI